MRCSILLAFFFALQLTLAWHLLSVSCLKLSSLLIFVLALLRYGKALS